VKKNDKIFLAGHKGLVGSAVLRKLKKLKYSKIITVEKKHLDLLNQKEVFNFLKKNKIKSIIICAARVGGIKANNTYKADFIYQNLTIQNNLIHGAKINNISNLIFLGSSCIYPKNCKQPIKEEYLLSGKLEKTNEPYAIAKIAGIKMCESYNFQYKTNYKCLMPTNTFGPGDNYDLESSHFFPALIKKIHECKIKKKIMLELWGNGKTRRELIFVDDLADAIVYFLDKKVSKNLINIGSGIEKTIDQYAKLVSQIIGVKLKIKYKKKSLVGTPRKLLDSSFAKKNGWKSKTNLKKNILETYKQFLKETAFERV
jgi:GDP-L-fucose synthase|tara:strand:+ start:430 stop:1371 length:942 start_codon:yes stop_codon:yes gene_type:complete